VNPIRHIAFLAALAGLVFLAAGCKTVVPPFRTLPPNLQTVYIPMVENYTYEPAIEEIATKAIQKKFMTDGRLRVTDRRDADIIVLCKLDQYYTTTSWIGNDDIAGGEEIHIFGEVLVFEKGAVEPLGQFKEVTISWFHGTDTRYSIVKPEPQWKEELFRLYADEVVKTVISGDYSGEFEPEDPTKPAPLPKEENMSTRRRLGVGF
jgi:hypothetical protein